MSKHNVDIMVHFTGEVDRRQWQALGATFARQGGLGQVYQNPKLRQVLMVNYDPAQTSAQAILAAVHGQGIEARVVGM